MKISNSRRYAFGICAAAFMLGGCGGSRPPSTGNFSPVTAPGLNSFTNSANDATRAELFAGNNAASKILIYQADVQKPRPIGTITDGVSNPYNLAVDQHGTLYVQNGNNTITEYNKGQKIVSKTLSEPGGSSDTPTALAVGNDGTVYAWWRLWQWRRPLASSASVAATVVRCLAA
jgi:hypothetical protein